MKGLPPDVQIDELTGSPSSTRSPNRRRRFSTVTEFLSVEVLGGLILVAAVIAALVWANLGGDSYSRVWSHELTLGPGRVGVTESLGDWVSDGLMTLFFFVAGLEIKRELVSGELRDPRAAALPVLAACGGMVVPALLFLAVNAGSPGAEDGESRWPPISRSPSRSSRDWGPGSHLH